MSRAEGVVRGCILKLQYADACMKPLPEGNLVFSPSRTSCHASMIASPPAFPDSHALNMLLLCLAKCNPLIADCSFSIDAHVDDLSAAPIESWVEVDPEDASQTTGHLATMVPIKSALLPPALKLQLHVEVP